MKDIKRSSIIRNKLKVLLLASQGKTKFDVCEEVGIAYYTLNNYLVQLRKAGYKIASTKKGLVATNIEESEINTAFKIIDRIADNPRLKQTEPF